MGQAERETRADPPGPAARPSNERMRELDGLKDDFLGLASHEPGLVMTSEST
jgi:hypothetical protein